MIFVTGDCHGEFQKFSTSAFPEQAVRVLTILTTESSLGRILTRRRRLKKLSANGASNARFSASTTFRGGQKSYPLTVKFKTPKRIWQRLIIKLTMLSPTARRNPSFHG